MKKTIMLFAFIIGAMMVISSFRLTISDEDKKGLGRVMKIQGVEVYLMSEPLREYETVEDMGSGMQSGFSSVEIDELANRFVKRAIKAGEKKNKPVDAIIYTSGSKCIAIKFK